MTIEKTDKHIEIWKTMDISSNDISWKNHVISKLMLAKRYVAEPQIVLSLAKHFRKRTSLKFKNKFLEDILIFSEEHLQINGIKNFFDKTRIKYMQNNCQYSSTNELRSHIDNKFNRLKSLLVVPIILVVKCINILLLRF